MTTDSPELAAAKELYASYRSGITDGDQPHVAKLIRKHTAAKWIDGPPPDTGASYALECVNGAYPPHRVFGTRAGNKMFLWTIPQSVCELAEVLRHCPIRLPEEK